VFLASTLATDALFLERERDVYTHTHFKRTAHTPTLALGRADAMDARETA